MGGGLGGGGSRARARLTVLDPATTAGFSADNPSLPVVDGDAAVVPSLT